MNSLKSSINSSAPEGYAAHASLVAYVVLFLLQTRQDVPVESYLKKNSRRH